jgi:phage head maturation protease
MSTRIETRLFDLDEPTWLEVGPDLVTLHGLVTYDRVIRDVAGLFRETIQSGFFAAAIHTSTDVTLRLDSDHARVLDRPPAQILQLDDTAGLALRAKMAPDVAADLLRAMERTDDGNRVEVKLSFTVAADGERWSDETDGTILRTLIAGGAAELHNIAILTHRPDETLGARLEAIEANRVLGRALELGLIGNTEEDRRLRRARAARADIATEKAELMNASNETDAPVLTRRANGSSPTA